MNSNNKNVLLGSIVIAKLAAIDIIIKFLAFTFIPIGDIIRVIPGLFLTAIYNKGFAFGTLPQGGHLYTIIGIGVVAVILLRWHKIQHKVAFTLIAAGALGNVFDRLVYGKVRDFIGLDSLFIFNIADLYITIGATLLIWYDIQPWAHKLVHKSKKTKKKQNKN